MTPNRPWMKARNGLVLFKPVELRFGSSKELLADIGHSLHEQNRSLGRMAWSVAEHSIAVSRYLAKQQHPLPVQLAGLLHDAHEAFVGDMPLPAVRALADSNLKVLKAQFDTAIFEYLKVADDLWPELDSDAIWGPIAKADQLAFLAEWRTFIPWDNSITPDLLRYDELKEAMFGIPDKDMRMMLNCIKDVHEKNPSWSIETARMLRQFGHHV